ncbi:hypothetical protein B566_EDAN014151 [Ephemera danica]|nr:hypothetical protein B566_EDAN014151 [Ephemera danica]
MPVPSEDLVLQQAAAAAQHQFEPPPMKHRDTRDSISSTDSDVSLTYDGNSSGTEDCSGTCSPSPAREDDVCSKISAATTKLAAELSSDSEGSTSKDSGCEEVEVIAAEVLNDSFTPPDVELAARIVQQVEFYFSDVNITKDAFLLKHVKRNKEGYVSLKLISSFKRVKHLAKDWRVVAYALANGSQLLQVNEARTKLRRLAPLPRYDDTAPSRTVVAIDLPLEKPTIESVVDLFAPCGKLALVRILRPGNPVPADVRPFVATLPELAKVVCALIEFEDTDGAKSAVQRRPACAQAAPLQWGGMRVMELTQKSSNSNTATSTAPVLKERKKRVVKPKPAMVRLQSDYDSSCQSGSDAESFYDSPRRRSSTSSSISSLRSSPLASPLRILHHSPLAEFVNVAPWIPRRQLPATSALPSPLAQLTRPRSNTTPNVLGTLPVNVVRLPRGPDGTRGFLSRKVQVTTPRGRSASTPVCPVGAMLTAAY